MGSGGGAGCAGFCRERTSVEGAEGGETGDMVPAWTSGGDRGGESWVKGLPWAAGGPTGWVFFPHEQRRWWLAARAGGGGRWCSRALAVADPPSL